jgi:hydrogenase large subunit
MPANGKAAGYTEATRGGLGHWIEYQAGKITNYQVITPTCWNASPRDDKGVPGAIEQALIGVKVQDSSQPIELYRIIRSFDPCMGCAVHVTNANEKQVRVLEL